MASIIRFRRGTTLQHQTFTGLMGEITMDITKKTIVAHDGTTPGGSPLVTESMFNQFSANVYSKSQVDQLIANVSMELGNVSLAQVAITGSYVDLTNKPNFANVAISGNYNDLNNKPVLHPVALSGSYADLTGPKPTANVAFTNNYNDLSNRPTFANVAFTNNYSDLSGRPTFANVAFTGNYNDLINKPEFDGNIYVTQAQFANTLNGYATVSSLGNYVLAANILAVGSSAGLASQIYVNQQDNLLANIIATKANISELSNYVNNSSLTSTLSNYVTNTSLSTQLNSYVNNSSLSSTLNDYVTDLELTNTLVNFAASIHVHTLNDIANVVVSNAATGQVLTFNGTNWINSNLISSYTAPEYQIVFGGSSTNTSSEFFYYNPYGANFYVGGNNNTLPPGDSYAYIKVDNSGEGRIGTITIAASDYAVDDHEAGEIIIKAGDNNADDGVGGSVSISAGNADTPGVLNLASGSKPSRESSTLELAPNAIVLRTGYSSNMYQPTGRIELSTGMSEGQSGQIQISTGSGNSSGSINISTSYANAAGTINITVGTSEVSTSGGEINITAGDTGESVEEGYGGRITISGGNGTNSVSSYGGSIQIYPGQGSALEKDGIVEFGFRSGSIEITPSLSITINGFAGNGGQVLTSQGTGNAVVWSGPYISIAQLQDILNNSSNFSDFKAAILAL